MEVVDRVVVVAVVVVTEREVEVIETGIETETREGRETRIDLAGDVVHGRDPVRALLEEVSYFSHHPLD